MRIRQRRAGLLRAGGGDGGRGGRGGERKSEQLFSRTRSLARSLSIPHSFSLWAQEQLTSSGQTAPQIIGRGHLDTGGGSRGGMDGLRDGWMAS